MIYGATFADHRMQMSKELCRKSMLANGVDDVLDIPCKNVSAGRGAGYWQWMPEIVIKGILACRYLGQDFFVYSDAGVEFTSSITHITDRMRSTDHVWLFGNEHAHEHWCKSDVLRALSWKGTDRDKQVQASVHVWRTTDEALTIAKDWDTACIPKWMIDDSSSNIPNHPQFKEHRHPQAVLTCIAHTYGLPLHWWPTQYGNHIKSMYPKDKYPVLFNHHGKRDPHAKDGRDFWDIKNYKAIMDSYE